MFGCESLTMPKEGHSPAQGESRRIVMKGKKKGSYRKFPQNLIFINKFIYK